MTKTIKRAYWELRQKIANTLCGSAGNILRDLLLNEKTSVASSRPSSTLPVLGISLIFSDFKSVPRSCAVQNIQVHHKPTIYLQLIKKYINVTKLPAKLL